MQERVYKTAVSATPAIEAAPYWHMGKRITKHHGRCCWSMEKAVTCMRVSQRTWLWTSAKIKRFFQSHHPTQMAFFTATNSLPWKTCHASRHLRRRCLNANKVSKSEEKESWIGISFLKVCWYAAC